MCSQELPWFFRGQFLQWPNYFTPGSILFSVIETVPHYVAGGLPVYVDHADLKHLLILRSDKN